MAAPSGSEDEDEAVARKGAAAWNASIYLMVSVPYVLLGVVGFLIYRGCRKNQEYLRARGQAADQPNPAGERGTSVPCWGSGERGT